MHPYLELFGTRLYMTGIGIVVACVVFLITAYFLTKRYNQNFLKLFDWFPWLLIPTYFLGLYVSFVLGGGGFIPTSWKVFIPYGYHFNLIGLVLGAFISILLFLKQFRRNETKKIWIDILFFSIVNSLIVLGVFLVLGDNFIGKPYLGALHVTALVPESALIKYGGVYPLGLFLSLGALVINVIVTLWKLIAKKAGIGIWGFILIFVLFLMLLPFWNYPAHGVISLFGKISLDLNHYVFGILIVYCLFLQRKLRKPY